MTSDPASGVLHDEKTIKKKGDPSYFPESQAIGNSSFGATNEDWHSFAILAENYRIEGGSRSDICGRNASVSNAYIK